MTEGLKQVIVIRHDLNMRQGKAIAQGCHASNAASRSAERSHPGEYVSWMLTGMTKVCVRVESEEELLGIFGAARAAGLPVELVTDAGHTEFHGVPTRTCLAIGPCRNSDVNPITGRLRLL